MHKTFLSLETALEAKNKEKESWECLTYFRHA
jgi:hypothetical protein